MAGFTHILGQFLADQGQFLTNNLDVPDRYRIHPNSTPYNGKAIAEDERTRRTHTGLKMAEVLTGRLPIVHLFAVTYNHSSAVINTVGAFKSGKHIDFRMKKPWYFTISSKPTPPEPIYGFEGKNV